jgi:predicted Zn-dependent peptidase
VISEQAHNLLYDILFERLRLENSLCYAVSVSWNRFKDYQQAGLSVSTSVDKLSLVEKEVWNVIHEISASKWTERFTTLHRLFIDQIKSKERLSGDILQNAANDILHDDKITTLQDMIADAQQVTYDQVAALIKKTFDPEYTFTEIILPTKK